jgi:hypothetical protein
VDEKSNFFVQLLPVVFVLVTAVVGDGAGIRALTSAQVVDNPVRLVDLRIN